MLEKKVVSQCISSDYCRGWNDAVDAMPRWISVKDTEHKPKHGKEYLCVCSLDDCPNERWLSVLHWYYNPEGNGYVHRPHFQNEGYYGMVVTHWAEKPELPPLPEPPKEEEK